MGKRSSARSTVALDGDGEPVEGVYVAPPGVRIRILVFRMHVRPTWPNISNPYALS